MFEGFFGFTRTPFGKDLSASELFPAAGHQEVLLRMQYLVRTRGLGVVDAEIGCGKTTTVRTLVSSLDPSRHRFLTLLAPGSPRGMYRALSSQLALEPRWLTADAARQVGDALSALTSQGVTPVLVVDEAHLVPEPVLTALRFLTQGQLDAASPLALLLVGQLSLLSTLRLKKHEALTQRINLRCHLECLGAKETQAYVEHHLRLAGREEPLFTAGAQELIFHHSRGVPRLINTLATHALLAAFQQQQALVDDRVMQRVLQENEL